MPSAAAADSTTPRPAGVTVFISYAHVDAGLLHDLSAHLSALKRERLVDAWDDRQILGGDDWSDEIDSRLNAADVILLLVTADFINSEYCYGKELARALERHEDPKDRAIVIPIILRKCDWESAPFARLQALPPGGARPLSEWKTPDDYYTAVTKGLRQRLKRLIDTDSPWIVRVGRKLRDPLWWQQPRVWVGSLAVLVLAAAAGGWWWQAATKADGHVAVALQHLRSGRHQDAVDEVAPVCASPVRRDACFVLEKAKLAVSLERPEALPLEQFAARVDALKARRPDDPDLLFFSAQLVLRENQPSSHQQAHADIARAIERTGGRFPEAHFYQANLAMLAGRHADALPLLDRALDPAVNMVAPAHYLNARAYARAQTGDIKGALEDYEQSAELGSILSRIELAELLWTMSEFDRASDQLLAADRALADATPLAGRNALPWAFETQAGPVVLLKQTQEKRCFARWMHRAGLALAGRPEPETPPTWADCGPEATRIASALAASLARAGGAGMNDTGRERALQFARQHRL
jgi:tetratricopeptide (TPR) repeat protein